MKTKINNLIVELGAWAGSCLFFLLLAKLFFFVI